MFRQSLIVCHSGEHGFICISLTIVAVFTFVLKNNRTSRDLQPSNAIIPARKDLDTGYRAVFLSACSDPVETLGVLETVGEQSAFSNMTSLAPSNLNNAVIIQKTMST